jgi:hypothetical protein
LYQVVRGRPRGRPRSPSQPRRPLTKAKEAASFRRCMSRTVRLITFFFANTAFFLNDRLRSTATDYFLISNQLESASNGSFARTGSSFQKAQPEDCEWAIFPVVIRCFSESHYLARASRRSMAKFNFGAVLPTKCTNYSVLPNASISRLALHSLARWYYT